MTRFPRLFLVALAVLAVGLACLPAEAGQPGGRPGGGGFGMGMGGFGGGLNLIMVASNPQVQAKLEFTDAQKEAIAVIVKERRAAMADLPRGGRDATAEERDAATEARRKALAPFEAKIKEVVGDKYGQLVQIAAGLALRPGASALGNAEIGKAMGLSPETQAKVAAVVEAAGKETRAAIAKFRMDGGGGDRGPLTKELAELQKATTAKIAGLLSAEEKENVEKARKAAEGITMGDRRGRGPREGGGPTPKPEPPATTQ